MNFTVHSSAAYHRQELRTLGWETTLCNILANCHSPCRTILDIKKSYVNLLFDYLDGLFSFERINHLLEVGGGYGWLMRDFMSRKSFAKVTMIDICPHLLDQQRYALKSLPGSLSFREEDFIDTPPTVLEDVDLVLIIVNDPVPHILGVVCLALGVDFPHWCPCGIGLEDAIAPVTAGLEPLPRGGGGA